MGRTWSYLDRGDLLVYYEDDHPQLESKLQVLESLGLVREITYNRTKRFLFTEGLVDYLATNPPVGNLTDLPPR